jgi:nitric oxide reductase subunit B
MGVYGNLSIAAVLFCSKLLFNANKWNERLVQIVFWSLNIGLALMVALDLFPAGVYQLNAVLKNGLWYGRSEEFMQTEIFKSLTWLRIIGGSLFVTGGVLPLAYFIVSRVGAMKTPSTSAINHFANETNA